MSNIFNITQCNIAQLISESSRFLFHVMLIHITTSIIEGKSDIFNETLFKTLLITAIAITLYHVFFRKIVEPKLEKMKIICSRDTRKRREKLKKVYKKDPIRPKYRSRLDSISQYNEQEWEEEKLTEEETDSRSTESTESIKEKKGSEERFEEPNIYGEYVSKYRY